MIAVFLVHHGDPYRACRPVAGRSRMCLLTDGAAQCVTSPGGGVLAFGGVLFPDCGLAIADLLRLLEGRVPEGGWEDAKGRYAGAYLHPHAPEVVAFNDHAGIRDLYLWRDGDQFAVSDDFAALVGHLAPPARRLDESAAAAFVTIGFLTNRRTFAVGIRRAPPGAQLTLAGAGVRQRSRWRWRYALGEQQPDSLDEAVRECWERLSAAAERIHRLTQPGSRALLGLSGGLDSRVVAATSLAAGMRVTPYFFGEPASDAAEVAGGVAQSLDLRLTFPGRNRRFPDYLERATIVRPLADLEWCKYLTGREPLQREADALLSGHLGDHLFGEWSLRAPVGPEPDRELAWDVFRPCAHHQPDEATAERVVADIEAELSDIGGSVLQRKQGFWYHSVNMTLKQGGLFDTQGGPPHYSPFEDIDVITAALRIPHRWRLRNRFYRQLFEQYLPKLAPSRLRLDNKSNDHKPVEKWLRGNRRFASAITHLADPDWRVEVDGRHRPVREAVADIVQGQVGRYQIHHFFRQLTVHRYQRVWE